MWRSTLLAVVVLLAGSPSASGGAQEGAPYGSARDEPREFWMPFLQRSQELSHSQEPISPEIREELVVALRAALAGRRDAGVRGGRRVPRRGRWEPPAPLRHRPGARTPADSSSDPAF